MSSTPDNVTMAAIDGRDALAYVIIRPGSNDSGVVIEAAANGISKAHAAYALRHTAQSWDPDDTVGADVGAQIKAALADVERLTAELTDEQAAHAKTIDNFNGYAEDTAETISELDARLEGVRAAAHALRAERDRLNAELAELRTAEPARPSPGHSAIYMDGDRQVWSDYPTVPPCDEVLPMVWADEQTQSKADLAERGIELRVVGWIK